MKRIKVLIVENEFIIASDIESNLIESGYEIVGIADEVSVAVQFLEEADVDIVLLDITLEGKQNGIDLAEIINARFHKPFIFLTSNTSHQVFAQAKELLPAAYLLKPFNEKQVSASIDIALNNFYAQNKKKIAIENEQTEEQEDILVHPNALFLKKVQYYEKVDFCDILWLQAESNYTNIYTKSGKYTYTTVLKSFEEKLPHNYFIRVHRSYIVNLNNVNKLAGNMLLINDKEIPIKKEMRDEVFRNFNIM